MDPFDFTRDLFNIRSQVPIFVYSRHPKRGINKQTQPSYRRLLDTTLSLNHKNNHFREVSKDTVKTNKEGENCEKVAPKKQPRDSAIVIVDIDTPSAENQRPNNPPLSEVSRSLTHNDLKTSNGDVVNERVSNQNISNESSSKESILTEETSHSDTSEEKILEENTSNKNIQTVSTKQKKEQRDDDFRVVSSVEFVDLNSPLQSLDEESPPLKRAKVTKHNYDFNDVSPAIHWKWNVCNVSKEELSQPRVALQKLLKCMDKDTKLGHVKELNYDLTLRSLATLLPSNWLNEEVINAYFLLLTRVYPAVGFLSSYWSALLSKSHTLSTSESDNTKSEQERRREEDTPLQSKNSFGTSPDAWTLTSELILQVKQKTIRLLIIPVHVINHWVLCVVFFEAGLWTLIDSLGLETKEENIFCSAMDKWLTLNFNNISWTFSCLIDFVEAHQNIVEDYDNCGSYICYYADTICDLWHRERLCSFSENSKMIQTILNTVKTKPPSKSEITHFRTVILYRLTYHIPIPMLQHSLSSATWDLECKNNTNLSNELSRTETNEESLNKPSENSQDKSLALDDYSNDVILESDEKKRTEAAKQKQTNSITHSTNELQSLNNLVETDSTSDKYKPKKYDSDNDLTEVIVISDSNENISPEKRFTKANNKRKQRKSFSPKRLRSSSVSKQLMLPSRSRDIFDFDSELEKLHDDFDFELKKIQGDLNLTNDPLEESFDF